MSRTDSASRVVPATAERIFSAMVDPVALTRWLPPPGMTARFEHFDARSGGSYRLVLTYDDPASRAGKTTADSDVVQARFVEITPNVRIVQAVDFESDDPDVHGTMTMTWELHSEGADDRTRVEFRADDVPVGISPEDHAAGLASSLAQLAAYVEQ